MGGITNIFICYDKTSISALSLCDGLTDCPDEEDEVFCHSFNNLFYPSQICEMLGNAYLYDDTWICPQLQVERRPTILCNDPLRNLSGLTFDLSNPGTPSYNNKAINQTDKPCIYIPHPCGLHGGNSNGYHLISCEEHVCDEKHFKCPRFYCLAWRFVCNGHWECPGGMDEINCDRISCPGMFKCKNSTGCVSMNNTCDSQADCILGDDESLCSLDPLSHTCPAKKI